MGGITRRRFETEMIRSIRRISSFGVFANFSWPTELPQFRQFNLIYGWNYSGKTTLSRVFRCFEQGRPHADFPGAQIQLEAQDGAEHDLSTPGSVPSFRVFNTDFVRENVTFDDGSANPILVLGEDDIARQLQLGELTRERSKLVAHKQSNVSARGALESSIDKSLTRYARDFIKTPLSSVNYDKRRFLPVVERCKGRPDTFLLDDVTLADRIGAYASKDKKPALSRRDVRLVPIHNLISTTASLVSRVVGASRTIPWLKDDPRVETWVNAGRRLHDEVVPRVEGHEHGAGGGLLHSERAGDGEAGAGECGGVCEDAVWGVGAIGLDDAAISFIS